MPATKAFRPRAALGLTIVGALTVAVAMHVGPPPTREPAVNAMAAVAADAEPGMSYVLSDSPPDRVKLRQCPHMGPAPQNNFNCEALDELPDKTHVTLRCSAETYRPDKDPRHTSTRWFYVNEGSNGPHPGLSGWVYADLVLNQVTTPECTEEIVSEYGATLEDLKRPPLQFDVVGTCNTAGGALVGKSANFTPGGDYSISAAHPDGRDYILDKPVGTATADGSAPWRWPCKGDPPGRYSTILYDLVSKRSVGPIYFTIGPAPAEPATPPPPTTAPVPVPPTSTQPPVQAPSTPPKPTPPAHRTVTVYNQVTNGVTQMREATPAYLSTVTHNYCRRDGCMQPGTEVGTGAQLDAICQVGGVRTTNGQDNSAIDDQNPNLYQSTLWYGVRWADGRVGYISEVWIQPSDRGGGGLPGC